MWKSFKKLRFVNHWLVRHYVSLDARINKIIRRLMSYIFIKIFYQIRLNYIINPFIWLIKIYINSFISLRFWKIHMQRWVLDRCINVCIIPICTISIYVCQMLFRNVGIYLMYFIETKKTEFQYIVDRRKNMLKCKSSLTVIST